MLGGIIPNEVLDALWRNAFGEAVDLDGIDREYALNIYTMVISRRARRAEYALISGEEYDRMLRDDPLVQKLRDVILKDAEKTPADIKRAKRFNHRAAKLGLRWRANV